MIDIQAELLELAAIEAESIGWLPLEVGVYVHVGDPADDVIVVVGVPNKGLVGMNAIMLV